MLKIHPIAVKLGIAVIIMLFFWIGFFIGYSLGQSVKEPIIYGIGLPAD